MMISWFRSVLNDSFCVCYNLPPHINGFMLAYIVKIIKNMFATMLQWWEERFQWDLFVSMHECSQQCMHEESRFCTINIYGRTTTIAYFMLFSFILLKISTQNDDDEWTKHSLKNDNDYEKKQFVSLQILF